MKYGLQFFILTTIIFVGIYTAQAQEVESTDAYKEQAIERLAQLMNY